MDSIIPLVVVGAIYMIVFVVKNLGASSGNGDARPIGENFPAIEILEPEQDDTGPVASPIVQDAARVASSAPVAQREKTSERARQAATTMAVPGGGDARGGKKERLVRLADKSDAKRAFLYSEIFNRKY